MKLAHESGWQAKLEQLLDRVGQFNGSATSTDTNRPAGAAELIHHTNGLSKRTSIV
jgi:hypothetical protein